MPKINLFGKILLSILLLSFIIEVVFLIITIREQTKNLEESLIHENTLFAQTIVKAIESGYLHFILPGRPFRELSPNILFLWIVKPNGEVYLADTPEMLGKTIKDSSLGTEEIVIKDSIYPVRDIISNGVYSEKKEKIKLIIYPLRTESKERPWSLFIGISLKSIAAAQKRLLFIVLTLFIIATIPIFLAAFYLARVITRPLKQLEDGVRIIGKGNLDHQIKLKTGDEFEELGESFNKMAQDLKRYYATLEESKDVLEIRVKARTKEIRELADSLEERVKERTKGLLESREALLNMLEDVEEERKITEEEKNKTLAIIRNFVDGLLVFSAENNLLLINPQAEEFLRTKSEQVGGRSILELSKIITFQPLIKILGKRVERVFKEELEISEGLTLEVSTVPIIREKEKLGTLVVLHNVTREKLIERMKTEFVSLAAHQLRTPLSAIKWTLKMFLDGDLGELNKEQKEFLDETYKSNERMIALINDLLNITRIEEGRYIYNLTFSDIGGLAESVINSYQKEIRKKRIEVRLEEPAGKLPKTILDVEKMKIAIDNIFDNAIRYTPAGGRVTVSLKCGKKDIEFSIKDTGIGISEKQQKRVFTKFFRGINVVKMETEGTGLGLFISRNIIEAHGGRIWFDSKEGKGTTFYFTIPIRKRSSAR